MSWLIFHASLLHLLDIVRGADLDGTYYRRRAFHSVAVLNDRLYIDGGEISEYVNGELGYGAPNRVAVANTTSIPLNVSWSNRNVHEKMEYTEYPEELLPSRLTTLFKNEERNMLYRWGGAVSENITRSSEPAVLGVLTTNDQGGKKWYTIEADQDEPGTAYGVPVTCGGLGLSFGGEENSQTVYNASKSVQEGVVEYNLTNSGWKRYGTGNPPGRTIEQGQAVCLEDFLGQPLILVFGGKSYDVGQDGFKVIQLNQTTIYDPLTKAWYKQNTIGDVPSDRFAFCSVGVKSRDNTTFEIFAYGGQSNDGTLRDMCILSLPAFRWFCLGDEKINNELRVLHTCSYAGNNQMIVVGGFDAWPSSWPARDSWPNNIGIYDLTKLEWSANYNADADPYDSPDIIKQWYSDNNREQVEWTDGVKALFASVLSDSSSSNNNSTSSGESTDSVSSESSSEPALGPIIGGVVGGLALISIIAILGWLFFRRRHHKISIQGDQKEESVEMESQSIAQRELDAISPRVELDGFVLSPDSTRRKSSLF